MWVEKRRSIILELVEKLKKYRMSKSRRHTKVRGKKATPPFGSFCTMRTNGACLEFNINTDQISGAQIHTSLYPFTYSFIHIQPIIYSASLHVKHCSRYRGSNDNFKKQKKKKKISWQIVAQKKSRLLLDRLCFHCILSFNVWKQKNHVWLELGFPALLGGEIGGWWLGDVGKSPGAEGNYKML